MKKHVSPIDIGRLIQVPIKHFFEKNAPEQFRWSADAKKTKVDISMINDVNKENLDDIPQILVSRGDFSVGKNSLSDNMAEKETFGATFGLTRSTHFLIYQGTASVIIRSRNEGTAEILADMVMHVLQWSRPHICDVLGFKDFGLPMQVSDTRLSQQHTEVFEVTISIPYMKEEAWRVSNDALLLRDVFIALAED